MIFSNAEVKQKVRLEGRVYRAATNTWEDLGVIYDSQDSQTLKGRFKIIFKKIKQWLQS